MSLWCRAHVRTRRTTMTVSVHWRRVLFSWTPAHLCKCRAWRVFAVCSKLLMFNKQMPSLWKSATCGGVVLLIRAKRWKKKKSHFPKCTSHVICHVSLLFFINFKNVDHKVFEFKKNSLLFLLQSVENCACILHNLTFQLESESPQSFNKYYPQTEVQPQSKKGSPIGCFSPKSSKAQKQVQTSQPRDPPPPKTLLHFLFFFFLCH